MPHPDAGFAGPRPGEPACRFDEFMAAALYDPSSGFYGAGRGRAGRRGDFLTSPEVGPLFGAVLARALDAWWTALGRPARFVVVDAGAGAGTLLRSLRAAGARWELVGVEVSAALRADHPLGVESLAALPERADVIVANELLDNLPCRLVEWRGGAWREVLVGVAHGQVVASLGDAVVDSRLPRAAAEGARAPLQDAAVSWVRDACTRASRVVAFDYGSTTAELAARPWREWLRTYRAHGSGGGPLEGPGTQDITCEVAWDQLPQPEWRESQADFLRRWGIDDLVEEGRRTWQERAHLGDLAALTARSRAREAEALLDPAGLGAFSLASWKPVARPD